MYTFQIDNKTCHLRGRLSSPVAPGRRRGGAWRAHDSIPGSPTGQALLYDSHHV